jgi:hypothetical protein
MGSVKHKKPGVNIRSLEKGEATMDSRIIPYLRFFILCLGAIALGSVLTDLDHFLPPHNRSWSDNYVFPLVLGGCLGIGLLVLQIILKAKRHNLK